MEFPTLTDKGTADHASELVSARPTYIENENRGPQSAHSNGTDLYLSKVNVQTTLHL